MFKLFVLAFSMNIIINFIFSYKDSCKSRWNSALKTSRIALYNVNDSLRVMHLCDSNGNVTLGSMNAAWQQNTFWKPMAVRVFEFVKLFQKCCLNVSKRRRSTIISGGIYNTNVYTLIARFMGPTWGPSGADRTQVGLMLAPWTSLLGWTVSCLRSRWRYSQRLQRQVCKNQHYKSFQKQTNLLPWTKRTPLTGRKFYSYKVAILLTHCQCSEAEEICFNIFSLTHWDRAEITTISETTCFNCIFLEWKWINFAKDVTEICSWGSDG